MPFIPLPTIVGGKYNVSGLLCGRPLTPISCDIIRFYASEVNE